MINSLISSLKGELGANLTSQFGLEPDKVDDSVELAKDNVTGGLKSEAAKGNFSGIKEMLSGNHTDPGNPIVGNITNNYIGDLTSKLGLSPAIASAVGKFVIPFILQKLGNKTQGGKMDQGDILGMLGGGDALNKIKEGFGGKIGGLFGK